VQLSDIALEWMIQEIKNLPDPPEERIVFNPRVDEFLETVESQREIAVRESMCHDSLSFGKGWSWLQVIFWWIFGIFSPLISLHPIRLD